MAYGRASPHVCFKAVPRLSAKARDEISQRLETGLLATFGLDSVKKPWFMRIHIRGWGCILKFDGRSFSIVLGRAKWGKDEWLLLVDSNDAAIGPFRHTNEIEYLGQLRGVCGKVDAVLKETSWISNVRWYFQQAKIRSPTVATPDELPWADTEHK